MMWDEPCTKLTVAFHTKKINIAKNKMQSLLFSNMTFLLRIRKKGLFLWYFFKLEILKRLFL